jgi:hypothetical protein
MASFKVYKDIGERKNPFQFYLKSNYAQDLVG